MKRHISLGALLLALGSATPAAEVHDHGAETAPPAAAVHDHPVVATPEAAAAHDHSVVILPPASDQSPAMQQARHANMMMHGDALNYLVLGERFEWLEGDHALWEAQGWVGRDLDKLWIKTEGWRERSTTQRAEVQALYSRALAPFWDLQAGVRHDTGQGTTRSYAVIGLLGLAPYWFETDLAAFVSERGDLSLRLEAEYELRFTQRLLLQPRVELNYSLADDFAAGIGKGLGESGLGLRLRYEIRREFAPYLGVEWTRVFGNTADWRRGQGLAPEEVSVVAGLRFWY